MALLFEPMHSANMWITDFFLRCFACDVTLENILISAPATVKEKVVLPAAWYFALFLAQLQASIEMVKSVLIWMCGTSTFGLLIWYLLVHTL